QKGTGRARAGSIRSPLWRGGGVIFGPKPRNYSHKMNRKEKRLALSTAFQSRLEDLTVIEDFSEQQFIKPKTKELVQAIARWGVDIEAKILLVLPEKQENVYLSGRNIAKLKIILANNLNIYDLLAADKIIATATAIAKIQEVYGSET
ncbi:MAG: 50S ribosomal protein L4, partial [Trichodesmium sp. MAG_R03]|nr:50S ribosomal protein L4 [Trichodesmium sp. MAG_R03]